MDQLFNKKIESLNQAIEQYKNYRKNKRMMAILLISIPVLLFIITVVLCFLFPIYMAATILIFFMAETATIFIVRFAYKKLKKANTHSIARYIVMEELGLDAKYVPKPKTEQLNFEIGLNKLYSANLFCEYNFLISEEYHGMKYDMIDANLIEKHKIYSKDVGPYVSKGSSYFKGKILRFDIDEPLDFSIKVFEGKVLDFDKDEFIEVKTESDEFNRKYKVYATDDLEASKFLSPSMINKMLEIENRFECDVQFSIEHGRMYIFMKGIQNSLDLPIFKKIGDEFLLDLVDEFKLGRYVLDILGFRDMSRKEENNNKFEFFDFSFFI